MQPTPKRNWSRSLLVLAGAVLAAAVACGAAARPEKGEPKGSAPLKPVTYDPRVSLAPLVEKVAAAVVNVRTTTKLDMSGPGSLGPEEMFRWFFGPRGPGFGQRQDPGEMPEQRSLGSGFIIDAKGLVVTNSHVVGKADEIEVRLADDRTFAAKVVGVDERTDVALLELEGAKDLPTVRFGDSDALRVGDHVVAIGNPFGLDHTVTAGIVSAKERVIGAGPYDAFIQTDASINPGNSGGPLFDLKGEVIGINAAIAPQGQGIGFAIPASLAGNVIRSLQEKGEVVRGWLGIGFQPLTEDLARAFGLEGTEGAVVASVGAGSPAAAGGLKSGDVIVEVAGKKLKDARALPTVVAGLEPGATAAIRVIRGGKPLALDVKVGKMPADGDGARERPDASKGRATKSALGFTVEPLGDDLKARLGANDVPGGVVVSRIQPGSPAAGALERGDIIVDANRTAVATVSDFEKAIAGLASGDDLLLHVFRQGSWLYVVLRV